MAACRIAAQEVFRVSSSEVLSPRRSRRVVRARQVGMVLARELVGASLPKVGNHFNRDHTTVLHAERAIADLRIVSPEIRERYDLARCLAYIVADNQAEAIRRATEFIESRVGDQAVATHVTEREEVNPIPPPVSKPSPRKGRGFFWKPEEDAALREQWARGTPTKEIAWGLLRTDRAVYCRRRVLKLAKWRTVEISI